MYLADAHEHTSWFDFAKWVNAGTISSIYVRL